MEFEIILIIIGMLIALIFLYRSTSGIQRSSNLNVDTETSFNRGRVLNSALVEAKGKSLTNEQIEILQDEIGLFSWIPNDLLDPWQERIITFLDYFIIRPMSPGLPAERIELIVAAEASLLIVQRPMADYRHLSRINIWADKIDGHEEARGTATRNEINLSWHYLKQHVGKGRDGHNLTLHEFAHLIDFADDGVAQSIPVSSHSENFKEWQELVNEEHKKLMKAYEGGKNYSIRAYGGYETIKGDKPELFSCGTSAFFERGSRLKRECPKVYQAMKEFYGIDPANWRKAKAK